MALTGWKYYREIQIDNTQNDTDLVDYQIKVILTSNNFDFSLVKTDGSDIRFIKDDVMLSYWIEKFDSVNQEATIWVKIPIINAGAITTVKMYYGNEFAGKVSDGDATFLFFDEFKNCILDTDKWEDNTGGYYFDKGDITFHSQDENWKYIKSRTAFNSNILVNYEIAYYGDWGGTGTKFDGLKGNDLAGSLAYSLDGDNGAFAGFGEGIADWRETPAVGNGTSSIKINAGTNTAEGNVYTKHTAEIIWTESYVTLNKIWLITYNNTFDTYIPNGDMHIIFGVRGRNTYPRTIYVNRVFVSKYIDNEPSITISEQITSVLSGIACDKNGNPITGKSVSIYFLEKDTGEVIGKATSNDTDGSWNGVINVSSNTKVLSVFALEDDYNGDIDIAGAEFDITADPDS